MLPLKDILKKWIPIVLSTIAISSFLSPIKNTTAHGQGGISGRVLRTLPSPGPSPQDLAWDGNYIWVADDSTDTLYKLNPSDGSVILTLPTPGPKPRGLTWDGSYLWCSDSDSKKIFKMNIFTGAIIAIIPAPVSFSATDSSDEVRGLTWDGQYLWSAYFAGWGSRINQVDPIDGTIMKSIFAVSEGLAFDRAYLWSVDSQDGHYKGFIDKLDILTGYTILSLRTPGYYPTGLTFDGSYFWLADKGSETIDEISLKGDVNQDAALNILDVIRCVNIILRIGNPPTEYELWSADYTWDGVINVLDVVGMINEILGIIYSRSVK